VYPAEQCDFFPICSAAFFCYFVLCLEGSIGICPRDHDASRASAKRPKAKQRSLPPLLETAMVALGDRDVAIGGEECNQADNNAENIF